MRDEGFAKTAFGEGRGCRPPHGVEGEGKGRLPRVTRGVGLGLEEAPPPQLRVNLESEIPKRLS